MSAPGLTACVCHAIALVMRVFQAEGYSGRDVVVITGPVPVRAECRSTVLKMCFD